MNYRVKAINSFRTKMNMFIYSLISNGQNELDLSKFQKFEISEDLVTHVTQDKW